MSFPLVPTAAGQIVPGMGKNSICIPGFACFDPCAAFAEGTTAWRICKGFGPNAPDPRIPFDPTTPTPSPQCSPGFTWSQLLQRCISDNGDPTPDFDTPAETSQTTSMHQPNGHADTIPSQREIRRRVCRKGSVLGKDGWCHQHIANKDREYPKPRKALGTPGELNALATSKKFAKRLLAADKGIRETARDLAKAGGIKLGGR